LVPGARPVSFAYDGETHSTLDVYGGNFGEYIGMYLAEKTSFF
jgi:hypothetical protein